MLNKSKIILQLLIVALLLCGCKEVSFKEAQPKGVEALKELPVSLRGRYLADKDTMMIESWGYHGVGRDKDSGGLSDTIVVKFYQNYYFVNVKLKNDQWALRLIRQKHSGALEVLAININDEEGFRTDTTGSRTATTAAPKVNKTLKRLSEKLPVTEVEGGDLFQIDPTPAQLMELIKEGYFTKSNLVLKKVK